HAFPSSIIDAMVRGDVLQIVAFSVFFALAVSAVGEKGQPIVRAMESLAQIMFKFTNYVMMFAPIGVGAAMAHTIGTQGLGVLVNLGKLIGSLYLALIIFVALVLGTVAFIVRLPVRQFFRAVREPAALAFATTSSESALPKAMESMERFGVPPHIVGFVMPTGYSFNLDGSTLYLALASVFVAQAAETTIGWHMGLAQQIAMMLTLMLTSKGVAAVPRASLVILLGTLNTFLPSGLGPIGVAIIFGVDELMDMGRTCVNVIGNCLATAVGARWEGEFDDRRALVFGTPAEAELDVKMGNAAFASAVAQRDSAAMQLTRRRKTLSAKYLLTMKAPSLTVADSHPNSMKKLFAVSLLLSSAALTIVALAAPSQRSTLRGSKPDWAKPGNRVSAAASSKQIGFRVYLGWNNASGAEALARAVSDPRSRSYGHYLTPAQFRQQFEQTANKVAKVQSWLTSQGFSLFYTPQNNHYVSAEGTVAQAQAAFGVQFGNYRVNGLTLRSPAADVT